MPAQKTITVYSFSELSEKAKEKARCKFIEYYDFSHSAEFIIEDAEYIGTLFGLDIEQVSYSSFYRASSGASFSGEYRYQTGALKAVKEYAPKDADLHTIVKALQATQRKAFYKLRAECYSSNRGNLRVNLLHADKYDFDVQPFEDGIESALNDFASWIYSNLEREYEYQTSDDTITEYYSDNEQEFTADGDYA